uniref:Ribosomal protein S13 n=1 Tax=Paraurostyla sp. TaxID=6014 RepID=A0A3S6K742_9STIC|nr:ribosomal protein S13 [Paraurostyla sp.]
MYWSRSFLYGGKTQPFQVTFFEFFDDKPGISKKSIDQFIKRFEAQHYFLLKHNETLLSKLYKLGKRKTINIYLSKILTINYNIFEIIRFNHIRLYLIKTFRGRCHALGKPSRGQRTWSNAKNAYKCNNYIQNFIQNVKKINTKKPKKFKNLKNLKNSKSLKDLKTEFFKNKLKKKQPKLKMLIIKKKKNIWF